MSAENAGIIKKIAGEDKEIAGADRKTAVADAAIAVADEKRESPGATMERWEAASGEGRTERRRGVSALAGMGPWEPPQARLRSYRNLSGQRLVVRHRED